MGNWFEWIKKHKYLMILISIFLIIGIPFIINICYMIPAPFKFMEANWETGSVLEYYGAVLGFAGTVILSMLALWQNHMIKEESDKREELMEKLELTKHMPILKCQNQMCNGYYSNLKISLSNVSDNLADDITVSNFTVQDRGSIICQSWGVNIIKTSLVGRDSTIIEFNNSGIQGENLKISFELTYKDKFQNIHICDVIQYIKDPEKFSSNNIYKIIEIS